MGLCTANGPLHSNNQDILSNSDIRDLVNFAEILSDDETDSEGSGSLADILQKVLDIDDLLCFEESEEFNDDDIDEVLPPELDDRCNIMEPDIPHCCEVELPRPVNWQLRLLMSEEEEMRANILVQAAE